MEVKRAASLGHRPLRHEGHRHLVEGRDLLDPVFVDHMPVGHLQRFGKAQVDLLLPEPPLALAVLHRHRGPFHAVADLTVEPLRFGALQDVVVLDVATVRLEVAVVARRGLLVGVLEQIELELGPGLGVESQLAGAVDLTAQHLARRDGHRLALHGFDVAEDERGLLQPGQPPNRRQVGMAVHVAVARPPVGEFEPRERLVVDVHGQQVIAGV